MAVAAGAGAGSASAAASTGGCHSPMPDATTAELDLAAGMKVPFADSVGEKAMQQLVGGGAYRRAPGPPTH